MLFSVFEPVSYWQGESPLRDILRVVERNPFAPLTTADYNFEDQWRPYVQQEAWQELQADADPVAILRTQVPHFLQAMVAIGPNKNHVTMEARDAYLDGVSGATIIEYVWDLAQQFPNFRAADIMMEAAHVNDMYSREGLRSVNVSYLGYNLNWYHLVSPAALAAEPSFTRETLLSMPAYRVREFPNGWISLQLYDDPRHYASPQAHQTLIDATKYLLAHKVYR